MLSSWRTGHAELLLVVLLLPLAGSPSYSYAQNRFFTEIPIPFAKSEPHGILEDSSGGIWFAMSGTDAITMLDPTTSRFSKFDLPGEPGRKPTEIAMDSRGNIWFTEYYGNRLGVLGVKYPLVGLQFDEFLIPTPESQPGSVSIDGSGNVWFTESATNKIAMFASSSRSFKEWSVPTTDSSPWGLCIDPKDRIWFTEAKGNNLGMFDPQSEKFQEYRLGTKEASPQKCVYDGGRIWFAEMLGNNIAAFDVTQLFLIEFPVPTPNSWPRSIATDGSGNIWYTELQANKIGRFSRHGQEDWAMPTEDSWPMSLTIDKQDRIWVTEYDANKIASVVPPTYFVELSAEPKTGITVDDKLYDSSALPLVFEWETGSKHSVSLKTPLDVDRGTRYVFSRWNDGLGSSQRQIEVSDDLNLVALGKIQYLVEISSQYGHPTGGGWYDAESNASITIEKSVLVGESVMTLSYWTGDISTESPTALVHVDSPKQLVAVWGLQTNTGLLNWVLPIAALSGLSALALVVRRRRSVTHRKTAKRLKQAEGSLFLSHSHADKKFARKLTADLEQRGVRVWMDEAEMMVGDSLIEKISKAIDDMDYVGVILSKSSVKSQWVRKEVAIAMTQEIMGKRVKVLPLLLEDCEIPAYIQDKLYADFRSPSGYEKELLRIVSRVTGGTNTSG